MPDIRLHGHPSDPGAQRSLLSDTAAAEWDRDIAHRAIDELFVLAKKHRTSESYFELMEFVARFRDLAPFNAMLINTQMSGAQFVASAGRWKQDYQRSIKPAARPLVILQTMGPVMFVFDVSDTVPEPGAPPLPPDVEKPFDVRGQRIGGQLERTIQNAARDGIEVHDSKIGSQGAGMIGTSGARRVLRFPRRVRPAPEYVSVPVRYDVMLNDAHSREAKYATLAHELAHLYCGHLGSPDTRFWPDRRFVDGDVEEFEAESVSYLVCRRLGIETRSEAYLSGYVQRHPEPPQISLECVLKAAGLIEQMGRERLPPRPEPKRKK
ncbi:MAG: ImmA/IrrE family metallo-endopeptidase [Dehalococcoidia bacterium]